MRIVHITDLHVASAGFVPEWGERLIRSVNAQQADLIVVTGDLVDDGLEHEYVAAKRFLDQFETRPAETAANGSTGARRMLVVPGNHDLRYNGGALFDRIFGGRQPTWRSDDVLVVGADSAAPDVDDGSISAHQMVTLAERLSEATAKTKILALHHHIMPIPGSGRDRDIVSNAGDVLHLCLETGVDVVLTGHMHRPWIWRLDDLHVISGGTATTNRYKGGTYPAYGVLDLGESAIFTEINVRDESTRAWELQLRNTRRAAESIPSSDRLPIESAGLPPAVAASPVG